MPKILLVLIPIVLIAFLVIYYSKNKSPDGVVISNNNTVPQVSQSPSTSPLLSPTSTTTDSGNYAAIKTKDGQIVIKLYSDVAPNTVKNFLSKANKGLYNGLTFHRVIPGFMAQGGDPEGTGTGGGTQKSELNQRPFVRGSLGLARTPVTKEYSNDSQFFICFTTEGCQHLTGDYVNFGEVVSGLDILDKITQGDKILEISSKTK